MRATYSISNSLPTNEDICSSVITTWGVCYSACAKVLSSPSQKNMGDRPKGMSCPPRRFVEEFCQLREQKMEKVERKHKTDRDLYDVGVIGYDAKTAKN